MNKRTLVTFALFFTFSFIQAQVTEQTLIWLRYFNKLNLTEDISIHTELEERRFVNPDRIHQRFLPRIGLNYGLNERVDLNVGFTYFQFFVPNDPTVSPTETYELRPHQYFTLAHRFGRFSIQQRYMMEQRFFERIDSDDPSYQFNFRVRHLTTLRYKLFDELGANEEGALSLVIYDEIMFQSGEGIQANIFDQNRFFVGTHVDFGKRIGLEVGVFNWFQQLASGDEYFSRYIGRVTLTHNINL